MEAQGIGYWLTKRAFLNGDREAIVDGGRRVTYRELNDRVNRLSRALQSLGLRPGDRCALLAYNGLEYVEVILAAAKMGLLLVPLNWRLSPAELAFNLSDSGTETLIFDPGFAGLIPGLVDQTPVRRLLVLGEEEAAGAPAYEKALARQPEQEPESGPFGLDTPHIIMYTAGTTGSPDAIDISSTTLNRRGNSCFVTFFACPRDSMPPCPKIML